MPKANRDPSKPNRPALSSESYWGLVRIQTKLNGYAPADPVDLSGALLVVLAVAERHERELRAAMRR